MKPEPDPIAIDLIRRLTSEYANRLWSWNEKYFTYECSSCQTRRIFKANFEHTQDCKGRELIFQALAYIDRV